MSRRRRVSAQNFTQIVYCVTLLLFSLLAAEVSGYGQLPPPELVADLRLPSVLALGLAVPTQSLAHRIRAQAFAEKGLVAESIGEYQALLQGNPSSHRDWLQLGWYRLEQGDPIGAVVDVRRAAKLHKGYMDSKNPNFLGERLQDLIDLALVRINIESRSATAVRQKELYKITKETYTMQRRFGRGCE